MPDSDSENQPKSIVPALENNQGLIKHFLTNQTEELRLRAEEARLANENDARQHDFATRSLDAQAGDRKDARATHAQLARTRYLCILVGVFGLLGLLAYAMTTGNQEFAHEVVKAVVYFLGGGGLGYGIGRKRPPNQTAQQSSDA